MSQPRPDNGHRTYRVPALIALASMVGLISALIGDGVFDAISWLALAAIVGVVAWAFMFRRKWAPR